MSAFDTYTLDKWLAVFKPIANHIDPNAGWQGYSETYGVNTGIMFETYGDELEFVLQQPEENVWTFMEDDDANLIIVAGYHPINRLGYFITEVARKPEDEADWNLVCIMVALETERN